MRPTITPTQLVDRALITDLVHEYCRALDAMELNALVALFTDDCVVEYGPTISSHGACALRHDLGRMWRWARTARHTSSNVLVRFADADTTLITSAVWAWHEAPDGHTATATGQYHDTVVRTADGWRIAARRQVLTGNDAGFIVDIHPMPRKADERTAAR